MKTIVPDAKQTWGGWNQVLYLRLNQSAEYTKHICLNQCYKDSLQKGLQTSRAEWATNQ